MKDDHHNVLWITFHDVSPRFGCYGDPVARTPNLDRLAAEGCRFSNAFAPAPVCSPSRSAIITGMYPTSIGTHHHRTTHTHFSTPGLPTPYSAVIPHYVKLLPEYLRAAGYYCTNNGETDYQFESPVTAWDDEYTTGDGNARTNGPDWQGRSDGQPFFAVFSYCYAHESCMWTRGVPDTDPASVILPPYIPDTLECRKALARQYDAITEQDQLVGDLLQRLERDSEADNTIVFVWADHGEGLPRSKRWPYDSGIRVPLLVRWPGHLEPGSVDERLVSWVDLAPTVLSLVGMPIPWHMQGKPFLGPDTKEREYVFAACDRYDESYDMVRAVRDRRYKYLRNYRPDLPRLIWIPYRDRSPIMREIWRRIAANELEGPQRWFGETSRPVEELYDTQADPHELTNLAQDASHREVLDRMRRALDEWRAEVGDMGELDEAQMKHAWYPGGVQPRTDAVVMVAHSPESDGTAVSDGGELSWPAAVQLHCSTQGASIAYTFEAGEAARWLLYTGPIPLPEDVSTLRAKAIRIGFAESFERSATFQVRRTRLDLRSRPDLNWDNLPIGNIYE